MRGHRERTRLVAGIAPLLVVLAGVPATAQGRQAAAWLDGTLVNWNEPLAPIPKAPPAADDDPMLERCRDSARTPASPEDRMLVAAGWMLLGPLQVFGPVSVVQAMAAFDGMCRPWNHQGFVFVEGRFAGTLSPVLMSARTDGAAQWVRLHGTKLLTVVFDRYSAEDPMCCPSSTSTVSYSIEDGVLVPKSVATEQRR